MIRVLIRLLAVLAAAPIVVLSSGASHACSCAMGDTAQYVEWADRVFTGTVVQEADDNQGDGTRDSTIADQRFVVAVDEVYKGDATAEVALVTASNSAACGLDALPDPDDTWVWYAHNVESRENVWAVSLCGGSGPVGGSAAELTGLLGSPVEVRDTSADPAAGGDADGPAPTSTDGAEQQGDTAETETAHMVWALGGITVLALGAAGGWRLRHRRE